MQGTEAGKPMDLPSFLVFALAPPRSKTISIVDDMQCWRIPLPTFTAQLWPSCNQYAGQICGIGTYSFAIDHVHSELCLKNIQNQASAAAVCALPSATSRLAEETLVIIHNNHPPVPDVDD